MYSLMGTKNCKKKTADGENENKAAMWKKWSWSSSQGYNFVSLLGSSLFTGPGDLESYDIPQRLSMDCFGGFT